MPGAPAELRAGEGGAAEAPAAVAGWMRALTTLGGRPYSGVPQRTSIEVLAL